MRRKRCPRNLAHCTAGGEFRAPQRSSLYSTYITSGMSTGKGKKRLRDIPVLHDEKKTRHSLLITPSSWKKLQRIAQKNGLSLSEYVEQWIISLEEGS
ncbi:hypothetical protein [Brasilonema octagenarum]|nr:hypothetical protein [Brasilonema octagenarum]